MSPPQPGLRHLTIKYDLPDMETNPRYDSTMPDEIDSVEPDISANRAHSLQKRLYPSS
jgi:hypothetical protein